MAGYKAEQPGESEPSDQHKDESWYDQFERLVNMETVDLSTEDLTSNPVPGKADRMQPKETLSDKLVSVGKGAAIAAAGAVLAYLTEWTSGQEFGVWAPTIAAVLAVATNAVRKLGTNW